MASDTLEREMPTALECAGCGYDVRAQPRDGVCPECGTAVEKAMELSAIPKRPAWRDSDPRWRRRMIAGAWVLVSIPVIPALMASGVALRLPVPALFEHGGGSRPLSDSFVTFVSTYLLFCVGVVLFFSKERGRRRHPLDWTRRWGVIFSYLVLLLGIPMHALVTSLVLIGIGALFMSLPHQNQPVTTSLVVELGAGWINYGPHDSEAVYIAAAVCSTCAILLACVPLYAALRCSGPKRLALVLLAPLAMISLWQISRAAVNYLYPPLAGMSDLTDFWAPFSFEPWWLVGWVFPPTWGTGPTVVDFAQETAKWLIFLVIALWLTIAQVRSWRKAPPGKTAA